MALFAQQISYTPLAWKALMRNPENRLLAVQEVVSRLGGRVVAGWYSFGPFDAMVIVELPDNISATALSIAVSAGGAMGAVTTVPLISMEDGVAALSRASDAAYEPPRSEIPYFGIYSTKEDLA